MPNEPGDYEYGPTPRSIARNAYERRLLAKGCSPRKALSVSWRKYP